MLYWKRHLLASLVCVLGVVTIAIEVVLLRNWLIDPDAPPLPYDIWIKNAITMVDVFTCIVLSALILPRENRSQYSLWVGSVLMFLFAVMMLCIVPSARLLEQTPNIAWDAAPILLAIGASWLFHARRRRQNLGSTEPP